LARGEKFFTKTGGLVTSPSSWDATKLQSEALKAFAHQSHRNRLYLFPDRNGLAIEENLLNSEFKIQQTQVLRPRSYRAMSQQFQHFYSHGILFFHVSVIGEFPRKLHSVPAVPMSRLPARLRGARP
jgi:hypothetical protein